MKTSYVSSISVVGVDGHPVRIEAAILSGLPSFHIVGLPDAALNESKERVRAAFHASGIPFPGARVIVNLSPADTPKSGTGFDVPIAVAILAAQQERRLDPSVYYLGELGLDGAIRPVRGILPAALAAKEAGASAIVVPAGAGEEAELTDVPAREVWHLAQIAEGMGLECVGVPERPELPAPAAADEPTCADLADVRGQEEARFALEIAAAGGHHLLMTGAPGVGKSMLASRLPGILPPLSTREAVEVAAIASAVGEFHGGLSYVPPFTAPHHTASAAALVGGGSVPRPGAVSRAHRGVLFLDELPEFAPAALQSLRQPMESGVVEIHRARMSLIFPARFQLIGAANPCRCGNFFEAPSRCTCSPKERRDYRRRIGGPIFDRFDVQLILRRPARVDMASGPGESTQVVAARVREARERQERRYAGAVWGRNADIPSASLRRMTQIDAAAARSLEERLARGELSMRAIDKALRVAWTLADLEGKNHPDSEDIHQALHFRERSEVGGR